MNLGKAVNRRGRGGRRGQKFETLEIEAFLCDLCALCGERVFFTKLSILRPINEGE